MLWIIVIRTSICLIDGPICWHPVVDPQAYHVVFHRTEKACRIALPRTCSSHPSWKCQCISAERLVQ
jgi:hypothetical protein